MELSGLWRDAKQVEEGEWVGDIPQCGALRLRVRGMTADDYQEALRRHQRAVAIPDRERDGSLKGAAVYQVVGKSLHEAVLLDWDGLTENGEPLKYSPDKALAILTDPDYARFQGAVVFAAGVVDNGRSDVEEIAAKNLPASSGGNSRTNADASTAPAPT